MPFAPFVLLREATRTVAGTAAILNSEDKAVLGRGREEQMGRTMGVLSDICTKVSIPDIPWLPPDFHVRGGGTYLIGAPVLLVTYS